METKDGRILDYGTTSDSRVFAQPTGGHVVRAWALKRVTDRSGNWMEYSYSSTPAPGDPSVVIDGESTPTYEHLVTSIVYTGSSIKPILAPNREVRFSYRRRNDELFGWYLGAKVGQASLLEEIKVFGPKPTVSGAHGPTSELRSYTFDYAEGTSADPAQPDTYPDRPTRLTSITECGSLEMGPSGRTERGCKPPTTFDWNGNGWASVGSTQQEMSIRADVSGWADDLRPLGGIYDSVSDQFTHWGVEASLEGPRGLVLPIDMDGDGRTDILYPGPSTWMVARALPGGGFTTVDTGVTGPVTPIDYDADGRTDLLMHHYLVSTGNWAVRLSNGSSFGAPVDTGLDAAALLIGGRVGAPADRLDSEMLTRALDFNGDGRDDILYCLPQRGWVVGLGGQTRAPIDVLRVASCKEPVLIIDLDGDGKVEVIPQAQTGITAERLNEPDIVCPPPTLPWLTHYQDVRIERATRVIDINGDGLEDILHSALLLSPEDVQRNCRSGGHTSVRFERVFTIWINRGDGAFEEQNLPSVRGELGRPDPPHDALPDPKELDAASVLDIDRDGRPDLLLPDRILYSDTTSEGAVRFVPGPHIPWALPSGQTLARTIPVDLDGDGHAELLGTGKVGTRIVGVPADERQAPHVVVAIKEGLLSGAAPDHPPTLQIHYRPMIDRDVYTPTLAHFTSTPSPGGTPNDRWRAACSEAWRCPESGRYLVARVDADNGLFNGTTDTVGQASSRYSYADMRIHVQGWGATGFGRRTVFEMEHPSADPHRVTQIDYANGDHRTAGLAVRQLMTVNHHVETTTSTPVVDDLGQAPPRWHTRIGATKAVVQEDGVTLSQVESAATFDAPRGCDGSVTSTVRGASGIESTDTTSWTYSADDATQWLLCRPDLTTQDSQAGGRAQRRTVKTEQVPNTLLPLRSIREPQGADNIKVTTELKRDPRGSVYGATKTASAGVRSLTIDLDDQSIFPVRQRNALGHVVELRNHPAWGAPLVVQDENGASTRTAYDALLRPGRVRKPDNSELHTTLSTRTGGGYTAHTVEDGGQDTTTDFDTLARSVRASYAILNGRSFVETHYDLRGRVKEVSRPELEAPGATPSHLAITEFDDLDRPILTLLPGGGSIERVYEWLTTTTTDPDGNQTKAERNARGQAVASTGGFGTIDESNTSYTFGPFGALLTVKDHRGNVTTIETDAWGRRTSIDDPDTGLATTSWSGLDEVEVETNAANETTTFLHDDLGRVRRRIDGEGTTRWDYDTAPWGLGKLAGSTTFEYSGHGASHSHHKSYIYDALGRPSVTTTVVGGAFGGSYASKAVYDEYSRLSVLWYPSSDASGDFAVRHRYDSHGFLETVARRRTPTEDGEVYWHAKTAWADGQIHEEERGNGLASTRTVDPASGRLTAIKTAQSGGEVLQALSYEWSHGGNLHKREDLLPAHAQYEEFEYDALSRLRFTHLRPQGAADVTSETRYDQLGNITFKSGLGDYRYEAPRLAPGVRPHAVSHAGAIELGYDRLGRIDRRRYPAAGTSLQLTQTLTYFQSGKLQSAGGTLTDPAAWFEYDADGNRLVRDTSPSSLRPDPTLTHTTTIGDLYERAVVHAAMSAPAGQARDTHRFFVHAGGRLVAEVTRTVNDPATPSARDERVLWINDDHLGSTDVISKDRGELEEARSFRADGQARAPNWSDPAAVPTVSSQVPRGFTGHEDDLFGLVNMGGRAYDPTIGRFLQPDPFVQNLFNEGWLSIGRDDSTDDATLPLLQMVDSALEDLAAHSSDERLRDDWLSGRSPGITKVQRLMFLALILNDIGPRHLLEGTLAELRAVLADGPQARIAEHRLAAAGITLAAR